MAFTRHYNFGERKKTERTVKSKEYETPAGLHAVELELTVDTQEAQQAILCVIKHLEKFKELRTVQEVKENVNFINGFLCGISMVNAVSEEQAVEIGKI